MTPAALLAAAAAVCAVWGLAAAAAAVPRRERSSRPWFRAAAALGRVVGAPAAPSTLPARIAAAGLAAATGSADVMAVKAGAGILGLLVAVLVAGGSGVRPLVLSAVVLGGAGFFAPDHWLARRARDRAHRAAMELPTALDLLRVAVEAGLPVRRALAEVGRQGVGVVAGELHGVASRVALGQPSDEALAGLHQRLPSRHVAILAAGIQRAERHGAPLGPTLAALAVEVRSSRAIALQERAARVVPRMQLVIALVLVPSVLALVAAVVLAHVL